MTASRLVTIALAGLLATTGAALAQQQTDPAFLQKALLALQAQRNQAMDGQASATAQATMLADENAKLKARVQELEAAQKPPEQSKPQ